MPGLIWLLCLASWLAQGPAVSPAASAEPQVQAPALVVRLPAELRDRFLAALNAFRSSDWTVAGREFGDAAWATTPVGDYALLLEAQSRLGLGDAAAARATALRVLDAAAEGRLAATALFETATLLSSVGDDKAAVTLLGRFLERHGDHREAPRARLLLGQTLLADGRTPEAAKAFKDLWILAPATPEAEMAGEQLRVLAGRGLGGQPATARERIERAEGLLAAGLGEWAKSEAEALLADAPAADLRDRALKIVLESWRRAGRWDTALATVNRALASLPEARRAPWLLELARLQQRRTRELALGTLDKLMRLYPKSAEAGEALLLKARLLEGAGRLTEAQAVYTKLGAEHAEDDEGGTALWRLGWLAWFRGAYGEAAATWARVLAIRGGQPHREAATYWVARAEELRGLPELAARRLAQLHAEAPRSYYGILAAQRSSPANASRSSAPPIVLPADPLEPLQTDAGYARVEALRTVGLTEFAEEEMAEMTRRAAGDPKRLYALSAVYVQDSRYHLALRILRRHFWSLARSGAAAAPRPFWEMLYPIGWRSELMEAAARAAIDPLFVAAVVREESSFYPQARSRVGARGLMQLMPETARPMAQARHLSFKDGDLLDDPAANLELGTAFLAMLLRDFGDPRLATAAYNAGPARVREWWSARRSDDIEVWVEQIPFNETRAFVKRVMLSWDEYRRLYGASAAAGAQDRSPIR
jgi:soluble lytic murein transglycosylase